MSGVTCEACSGKHLIQPECHDGRGRCDPIECPDCCGPDMAGVTEARSWMCNAIDTLAKGAAGVTGNGRGEREMLRITLRMARQYLDAAEKLLRRTE